MGTYRNPAPTGVDRTPNPGASYSTEAAAQPGSLWVKITGQATGTNRYAWTQIDEGDTAAFDTGLSAGFAATGTSAAGGSPAYEINGRTDVPTGTRVLLYPAGDLTYYVFSYGPGIVTVEEADGSPSVTGATKLQFDQADFRVTEVGPGVAKVAAKGGGYGARPIGCGWLRNVKPGACWIAYRRGGRGSCECWEEDDLDDPDAGATAVFVSGLGGWLAVERLGGDWPMINTCCGCGSLLFKIDPTTHKPSLKLGGVHGACDDGQVYSTTIDEDYVCGELPGGFRYVEFFGYDVENACDSEEEPCANEYSIMMVCGGECPSAACGCRGCGADPAPIAWYKQNITGFSDAKWNGDWVWRNTAACTWSATCDENTSTLEYVPGTSPVWRLTHGGSVYEVADPENPCLSGMTLTRVSGSASPGSIAVTPVQGSGTPPVYSGVTQANFSGCDSCICINSAITYEVVDQEDGTYTIGSGAGQLDCADGPIDQELILDAGGCPVLRRTQGHVATSGEPPIEVPLDPSSTTSPMVLVFQVPLSWFCASPWTGVETCALTIT